MKASDRVFAIADSVEADAAAKRRSSTAYAGCMRHHRVALVKEATYMEALAGRLRGAAIEIVEQEDAGTPTEVQRTDARRDEVRSTGAAEAATPGADDVEQRVAAHAGEATEERTAVQEVRGESSHPRGY